MLLGRQTMVAVLNRSLAFTCAGAESIYITSKCMKLRSRRVAVIQKE